MIQQNIKNQRLFGIFAVRMFPSYYQNSIRLSVLYRYGISRTSFTVILFVLEKVQ